MSESLSFVQKPTSEIHEHESNEQVRVFERLKKEAAVEVIDEMMRRFANYEQTLASKVVVLREMISEYGATELGTDIPLDNSKRFHAEATAKLLKSAENALLLETLPPPALTTAP